MVQSQFSLRWDSYKTSVCNGFSSLQQNGEFVDMTLAADGHFVKVHQMLVALASPYLKDLITSLPCQHPVIFLNNVSHRTLCSLLEYIYTGEVLVQDDHLTAFAEAASALHIKGLENIASSESAKSKMELPLVNDSNISKKSTAKSMVAPTVEPIQQIHIPQSAKRVYIKHEYPSAPAIKSDSIISMSGKDDMNEYTEILDDSIAADDNEVFVEEDGTPTSMEMDRIDPKGSNLQFTVSIRGSLQMILNRYIYNLNSTTARSGVRRWRCVDYRNNKCTAFVITRGNVVLKRANPHNHSFHDKKILDKLQKKSVFSALDDIESYKEKQKKNDAEDGDSSMEQDHLTLDDFQNKMDMKTTTTTLLIKNS